MLKCKNRTLPSPWRKRGIGGEGGQFTAVLLCIFELWGLRRTNTLDPSDLHIHTHRGQLAAVPKNTNLIPIPSETIRASWASPCWIEDTPQLPVEPRIVNWSDLQQTTTTNPKCIHTVSYPYYQREPKSSWCKSLKIEIEVYPPLSTVTAQKRLTNSQG